MSNGFFFHFKKHGLLNNYINVSSYKFIIMQIKKKRYGYFREKFK
jgi:hypothetical protein